MRLISDGFGSWPLDEGVSRSLSPSRMSLQSFTHSLQMYTDGPETSRATSSWPRPQNEHRIGCGVAMRFFMGGWCPRLRERTRGPGRPGPPHSTSFFDDLVHQTVRLRLLRRHPVTAIRGLRAPIDPPPGVLGQGPTP